MNNLIWLYDLDRLLTRFSQMGINPDIAAMGLIELWGVYCFLRRMAES